MSNPPKPAAKKKVKPKKGDKKTTDAGKIAEIERFQAQCFLLENFFKYSDWNNPFKRSLNTHTMSIKGQNEEIIGQAAVGADCEAWFGIKPHELSALVPKVRFFTQKYGEDGKLKTNTEIKFNDHYSRYDVANLLARKTERGAGAGMLDFSWDLLGGTPIEAKRHVDCRLKVFFSTVGDLVKDNSMLNLIKPVGSLGISGKEEYMRLLAEVGWHVPPKSHGLFKGPPGSNADKLRKAIANSNKAVFLHMRDHDLTFQQDGTLSLDIKYIGAIEEGLEIVDILGGVITKELKGKMGKLKVLKKKQSDFEKACSKSKKKTKIKNIKTGYKDAIMKLAAEIEDIRINALLKRYQLLMERMTSLQTVSSGGKNQKLQKFGTQKQRKNVRFVKTKKGPTSKTQIGWAKKEGARSRIFKTLVDKELLGAAGTKETGYLWWYKKKEQGKDLGEQKLGKRTNKKCGDTVLVEYNPKVLKNLTVKSAFKSKNYAQFKKQILQSFRAGQFEGYDQCRSVSFFFFGDLIDAVLEIISEQETMASNYIKENLRIIFGSIDMPRAVVTSGSPSVKFEKISLSDIPISFDLFRVWFLNTIVRAGRTRYLLKDFITDVMNKLLLPALGASCFGDIYGNNKPRLGFNTFTVPAGKKGVEQITGGKTNWSKLPGKAKRLDVSALGKIDHTLPIENGVHHYVMLYAYRDDFSTRNISGKNYSKGRAKDESQGIYHLDIGSDKGLVKEIKFNKSNHQFLAESLLQGARSDIKLDAYRRIYDCTITLFGNALFHPGQYIYVNPSAIGFGSPTVAGKNPSPARALGLGGYFMVTGVENKISSGEFETSLKCRWIAFGDGTKNSSLGVNANCADFITANKKYEERGRKKLKAQEEKKKKKDKLVYGGWGVI